VITPHTPPLCGQVGQGRLSTWVSFRSARSSEVGQFSVGANRRLLQRKRPANPSWTGAARR